MARLLWELLEFSVSGAKLNGIGPLDNTRTELFNWESIRKGFCSFETNKRNQTSLGRNQRDMFRLFWCIARPQMIKSKAISLSAGTRDHYT